MFYRSLAHLFAVGVLYVWMNAVGREMAMSYTASKTNEKSPAAEKEKEREKTNDNKKSSASATPAVPDTIPVDASDAVIKAAEAAVEAAEAKSDWTEAKRTLEKLRAVYLARIQTEQKAGGLTAVAAPTSAAAPSGGSAAATGSTPATAASSGPVRSEAVTSYVKTLKRIGVCHKFNRDLSGALRVFESIVAFEQSQPTVDKRAEAAALSNCGLFHEERSDMIQALACYEKARSIEEGLGDWAGAASTYLNIGMVHRSRKEWTKAIEWAQKSIDIRKKLADQPALAISYHTMAMIHFARADYPIALTFYELSAAIDSAILGFDSIWGSSKPLPPAGADTPSKPAPADVKSAPVNTKTSAEPAVNTKSAEPAASAASAATGSSGSGGAGASTASPAPSTDASLAGLKSSDPQTITTATLSLSATLHNMATIYNRLKQHGRALKCYVRSIELNQRLSSGEAASAAAAANVAEEMITTYHQMAQLLFTAYQFYPAIFVYEQIFKLEVQHSNLMGAAEVCTNLGLCFEALCDVPSAVEAYDRSRKLFTNAGSGPIAGAGRTGSTAVSAGYIQSANASMQMLDQRLEDAVNLLSVCGEALATGAQSLGGGDEQLRRMALAALHMRGNDMESAMNWLLEGGLSAALSIAESIKSSDQDLKVWNNSGRDIMKWIDSLGPNALSVRTNAFALVVV